MLPARLLDLNLEYFFREEAFSSIWNEEYNYELEMKNVELQPAQSIEEGYNIVTHKLYISGYRNWIYKDDSKYAVTVYKNGYYIDPSNYTIDFVEGRIIFTDIYAQTLADIDIITADFWYLYVNIINSYPEEIENNNANYRLPIVCIEGLPFRYQPYELGNAKGNFRRQYLIHILANDDMERDNLMNIILEHLQREWPLIDYASTSPLNEDGSKNTNFVKNEIGHIIFDDIRSDIIRERTPAEIMKHWGYINCAVNMYF